MIGTSVTPRASAWSSTRSSRRSGPPKKVPPDRHEEVEGGGVVEARLDGDLRAERRRHGGRLQHPGDRRQRADHEDVVGRGRARPGRRSCGSPRAWCSGSARRPSVVTSCPEVKITTDGSSGSRPDARGTPATGSAAPIASVQEPAHRGRVRRSRQQRLRSEHDRRLGGCDDVAHLGGAGARRRDHHQRTEAQHRVDRDHRDDVVRRQHEDRVVGGDAFAPQARRPLRRRRRRARRR